MKLPLSIAKKLLLMQNGEAVPASQIKVDAIHQLLEDGVVVKQRIGASKAVYLLKDKDGLQLYLHNHFGIASLEKYVLQFNDDLSKREAIQLASNSKHKRTRSFKGFLINSFQPINATLNNVPIAILPQAGSFQFIYDFENFVVDANVIIVGIENPTNFRWIEKQQHLFANSCVLFLSRYPQEQHADMIQWLQTIPNKYLHFGDFDFAGINVYLNEFKKQLGSRAQFFIPTNIAELLEQFGNRELYKKQLPMAPAASSINEPDLLSMLQLIHQQGKGLEQEILIV